MEWCNVKVVQQLNMEHKNVFEQLHLSYSNLNAIVKELNDNLATFQSKLADLTTQLHKKEMLLQNVSAREVSYERYIRKAR